MRERVLVVEDQKLVRMILAEVLSDEGFHIVEASTGDEAAALIDGPDGFQPAIPLPGNRDARAALCAG